MSGRLKGQRILVTRPRPFNEEACERIRDEGGDAIALPTLVIEAQTARAPATDYDWIIFVSRNAVLHGLAQLLQGIILFMVISSDVLLRYKIRIQRPLAEMA